MTCGNESPLCVEQVLDHPMNPDNLCQNHWVMTQARWQAAAFYVQDSRQLVGNCVLWWRPQGNGYTCHLELAGIWLPELRNFSRETDIKRPWVQVELAASRMVDEQYLQRIQEREQIR